MRVDLSLTLGLLLGCLPPALPDCSYTRNTGTGGASLTETTPTDVSMSWYDIGTARRGSVTVPLCLIGRPNVCHPSSFDQEANEWDLRAFLTHLEVTLGPASKLPILPRPEVPPRSAGAAAGAHSITVALNKDYSDKYFSLELEFRGLHCRSGVCVLDRVLGDYDDPAGARLYAHCKESTVTPTFIAYGDLQRRMEELRRERENQTALLTSAGTQGCSYVKGRGAGRLTAGINRFQEKVDEEVKFLPVCFMNDKEKCYPKDVKEASELTAYLKPRIGSQGTQVLFYFRDENKTRPFFGKEENFYFDPDVRSWLCLSGHCIEDGKQKGTCGTGRRASIWQLYDRNSLYYYRAGSGRVRGQEPLLTSLLLFFLSRSSVLQLLI